MMTEKKQEGSDNRFCYGATCTWFGSINEVSTTAKHPLTMIARQVLGSRHNGNLPCCPICGGMLFEMADENEWWKGIDAFERGDYPVKGAHPHPGYRKMLEWQKAQNRCFFQGDNGIDKLVAAYKEATGITVDVER